MDIPAGQVVTNDYAQDSRADFMNWSVWAFGAFDYAAENWGQGAHPFVQVDFMARRLREARARSPRIAGLCAAGDTEKARRLFGRR